MTSGGSQGSPGRIPVETSGNPTGCTESKVVVSARKGASQTANAAGPGAWHSGTMCTGLCFIHVFTSFYIQHVFIFIVNIC